MSVAALVRRQDRGTRNLLTYNQATVEADLAGFTGVTNGSMARVTTAFLQGSACLALTAGTAVAYCYVSLAMAPGLVAGRTYTAVASLKAVTTPRAGEFTMNWFSDASDYLGTSTGAITDDTSTWTQGVVSGVAPANATQVNLNVCIFVPADGEVHYIDCLGLWAGSSTTWVPPTA